MSNDDDERAKMITAGLLTLAFYSIQESTGVGSMIRSGQQTRPADIVQTYRQMRVEMDREPPRPPHDTGETGP